MSLFIFFRWVGSTTNLLGIELFLEDDNFRFEVMIFCFFGSKKSWGHRNGYDVFFVATWHFNVGGVVVQCWTPILEIDSYCRLRYMSLSFQEKQSTDYSGKVRSIGKTYILQLSWNFPGNIFFGCLLVCVFHFLHFVLLTRKRVQWKKLL